VVKKTVDARKYGKKPEGGLPLRLAAFALACIAVAVAGSWAVYAVKRADLFTVRHFSVVGNERLSEEAVVRLTGLGGKSILIADSAKAVERLKTSTWIRKAYVRKELPDTIKVKVAETVPVAYLRDRDGVYLVDDAGIKLEKVDASSASPARLLPVIKTRNSIGGSAAASNSRTPDLRLYMETVRLAGEINRTREFKNSVIEITGTRAEDISINVDGTVIYVGNGDYEKKLRGYIAHRKEIDSRHILVEYIDIRFANRLIVKPQKRIM
jgi:cell division septal protein FtsQ